MPEEQAKALEDLVSAATSPTTSSGAETACLTVHQMFQEADSDHNSILDANELATLMATMHKQVSVARKGNATMARDGTEAILSQIEMLDTAKRGGLNFMQFCQVLNMEPWNTLLPADISCQLLSMAEQDPAEMYKQYAQQAAKEGRAVSSPEGEATGDAGAALYKQYAHMRKRGDGSCTHVDVDSG